MARRALWDAGLNYGHGTGHGIGAFLNVHEYPPSISSGYNSVGMKENMFTSNGRLDWSTVKMFRRRDFNHLYPRNLNQL